MPNENTSLRPPLTPARVLQAAVDLADREGLGALTMRRLGAELGVEAMSLYKHVANKEAILDGIVELVVGEIEVPTDGADWKQAMRRRAVSARQVLSRHSWAIGLLEARGSTGPNALHYVDAILGNLRTAGFSITLAAHAFWLLDSYVYGHVIQETSLPFTSSEEMTQSTRPVGEQIQPDGVPASRRDRRTRAQVRIQRRQRIRIRPRPHPRRPRESPRGVSECNRTVRMIEAQAICPVFTARVRLKATPSAVRSARYADSPVHARSSSTAARHECSSRATSCRGRPVIDV